MSLEKIIESQNNIKKVGLYGDELNFKIEIIKKLKKRIKEKITDEVIDKIFNIINLILSSIIAALGVAEALVLEGFREFKDCLHIFIKDKRLEHEE